MADRRASLAEDFSEISDRAAERLLQALDADDLDHNVLRALVSVAGTATDKLATLADRLTATDEHGDSLLETLATGFASWAEHVANADQDQTNQDAVGGTHA